MLLAHHPDQLQFMRAPTVDAPWRVLVSGCLTGLPCGVDGSDNGVGKALGDLLTLPGVRSFPFCPEDFAMGTPRSMPDIHGGDGFDVLDGSARVFDQDGADLTGPMLRGARAMLDFARQAGVELAILTDMSAACGSQVISDGCRFVPQRRFQVGVGVATALLLREGIPVVSQRDFRTLARLRARLAPGSAIDPAALDHHQHPWVVEHLGSAVLRRGRGGSG